MKTHKILLSLFGFITLGLVNFGCCDYLYDYINNNAQSINYDVSNGTTWIDLFNVNAPFGGGFICFYTDQNYVSSITPSTPNTYPYIVFRQSNNTSFKGTLYLDMVYPTRYLCFELRNTNFSFYVQAQFQYNGYNGIIPLKYFFLNDIFNLTYPTPSDCSTCEGDLDACDGDLNTCQGNLSTCEGLYNRLETNYELLEGNYNTCNSELLSCLENGGSSSSGDVQWSSLFINENQVIGNKNIFVNIPLDYDFSYTNEGDDFELTVEGLNQDYDYLNGIVGVQKTIPSKDNLNQIISGLIPLFVPGLVVILFIYFVFRLLKKIF